MKKILAMLLALVMVLSLVACGNDNPRQPNEPDDGAVVGGDNNAEDGTPDEVFEEDDINPITSATSAINRIWELMPEDLKPMTFGGDYENNVENEAALHTIEDGGEELDNSIGYPAEMIDKIDEAAALRHMMNVNSFTCGAYALKNASDAQAVCDGIVDSLMNRSYLCGAPQVLVVIQVDSYIINAFGAEDIINAFTAAAEEAYGTHCNVLYNESMEGAHGDNGIDMGGLNIGIGF